jgi:hypothetical protein
MIFDLKICSGAATPYGSFTQSSEQNIPAVMPASLLRFPAVQLRGRRLPSLRIPGNSTLTLWVFGDGSDPNV